MRSFYISSFLFVFFLSACSSLKVVPEQAATGVINSKTNSQTIVKNNIEITVSSADPDLVNYNIDRMIASFYVEIVNNSGNEVTYDNDSIILLDSGNRQYYQLTPEKIREMMAKDTYYLLPYPYVGFYYLEDYERSSFKNTTNSSLPYYYEYRPQELYTSALPTGPVIPNAKIKGLIFFNADIPSLTSFSLNIYNKGTAKSANPDFIFPFKVIK